MALEQQLNDPNVRREYESSAHSFWSAGIGAFNGGKYGNAEFYLGLAGKIFSELGDRFHTGLVKGWFVNAAKRNTDSAYAQQLPAWCH